MARATPEKTPEKTPAKKAPKAKNTKKSDADGEKKTRRPGGDRGWLAAAIDKVLRKERASMTVAEIAAKVKNARGEHPSSGAVAACLNRWAEQGYIEITSGRPMAFKKFTAKYTRKSLDDFLEDQRAARAEARAEKKAAAAK